jgi:hypothetical protein
MNGERQQLLLSYFGGTYYYKIISPYALLPHQSSLCCSQSANSLPTMKKETVSRKELYDLVWLAPLSTLMKKYDISYGEIHKACTEMNIPLPRAGYWQKIQHGKTVQTKPLPLEFEGKAQVEFLIREEVTTKSKKAKFTPKEDTKATKTKTKLPLKVPVKLQNPDPLIVVAKNALVGQDGRFGRYPGIVSTGYGQLKITVSPSMVNRALRFMDTLIKLLKTRNQSVEVEYDRTYAVVEGHKIQICLREKSKVINKIPNGYGWTSYEYQPTGILSFFIGRYSPKEWKDGKLRLEEQLQDIILKLESEAQRLTLERIELEKYWQEQREKQRIEREAQERKQKEASAFKELMEQAQRWQQAKFLREYIEVVQQKAVFLAP